MKLGLVYTCAQNVKNVPKCAIKVRSFYCSLHFVISNAQNCYGSHQMSQVFSFQGPISKSKIQSPSENDYSMMISNWKQNYLMKLI